MITLYKVPIPADQIELPFPVIGDTQEMIPNQTINSTPQGKKTFYKGSRPTWYRYNFNFVNLTEAKKEEFRTFLINYAGEFLTLGVTPRGLDGLDQPEVLIDGFITSNQHTFTTNRDNCSYSVNMSYEITFVDVHKIMPFLEECE